jgi:hypothetical protein
LQGLLDWKLLLAWIEIIAEIIQKTLPAIEEFSATEKSAILEIIKPEF